MKKKTYVPEFEKAEKQIYEVVDEHSKAVNGDLIPPADSAAFA